MRPYTLKIPAGAESAEFFGEGRNVIRLKSDAGVNVVVKSPDNNEEYELEPGDGVTLTPFDDLLISHNGASEATFVLYVGKNTQATTSKVGGSLQMIGGADNTASPPDVNLTKSTTLVSSGDVVLGNAVPTLVFAAVATRREAMITNLLSNAGPIRVGSSTVAATNGVEISPGQTITIDTSAEIYAYAPAAGYTVGVIGTRE